MHTQKSVNISTLYLLFRYHIFFHDCAFEKKKDAALIVSEFPEPFDERKASITWAIRSLFNSGGCTAAYHRDKFTELVLKILDKHNKQGAFIAMNNCWSHHACFVVDAINEYKPLFIPPFLNNCQRYKKSRINKFSNSRLHFI